MQLMPGTAAQAGSEDSFSPEQNVHGGARYLRELLERYNGDAIKALAAYNAGPGAVDRYQGVPPYRETRQYVQRVVREYNKRKQNAPGEDSPDQGEDHAAAAVCARMKATTDWRSVAGDHGFCQERHTWRTLGSGSLVPL